MHHGHGDDGYRHAHPVIADFSTNVWCGGPPAGLREYVFGHWGSVSRYPEVLAESLAARIAAHHGVAPAQVLVSSGTTESIYLVAQRWAGQRTTVLTPSFAEYEDAARLHGHAVRRRPWAELTADTRLASDLVFICNPNNPTGRVLAPGLLPALLAANPGTVFVLDEAFIEFTQAIGSAVPLLARFANLLIMRSLTKAYAIPGLRLGYVLGPAPLVARLRQAKAPWTVNALAVAAGHFLFENYTGVQLPLSQLLADTAALTAGLAQNPGFAVEPSSTHYFLARTRRGTAAALKGWLLAHHGLLIRDAGNFAGLTPAHFRVGTRHPADNQLLLNALAEWTAPPA